MQLHRAGQFSGVDFASWCDRRVALRGAAQQYFSPPNVMTVSKCPDYYRRTVVFRYRRAVTTNVFITAVSLAVIGHLENNCASGKLFSRCQAEEPCSSPANAPSGLFPLSRKIYARFVIWNYGFYQRCPRRCFLRKGLSNIGMLVNFRSSISSLRISNNTQ